ncbi:bacillithiol biosynthesis cysteine-adding enzyme BshC [Algoriphagus sp. A40]|uniref:bacillithiol biosynthesis cysteine-adding enzyme BshC n=1 Tax=Algoriphagus sp. A40 TaxID=1945863 RepID=UPI000987C770|nr:bacillithiol biosynthesis cysteine-adding enzyme BshC [Algoriphagus sp. A40]OOG69564.1 bacillithiol biosynthesis cysteine-adding enzyme BshC [Algoriphagus sp. A40]
MKKHCVDLNKTGQFSRFFLDYIEGKETLRPFYAHLPKLESFREAVEAKNFSAKNREILHNALQNQYSGVGIGEVVSKNLESLLSEKTFTVTTGHQLNLFTGPLYFIYKLVSTINLAKKLKSAYPEFHFVPVYWMATEDHDFDEINYFKLDGKKYQWTCGQKGAVGDFVLDETFKTFLKEVHFAPEVFKKAYQSSKTLGEAVRKYVNQLFGEEGLIVVDGNDSGLKSIFKPVITSDLFDHTPFEEAQKTTQALEELGYKSQIFPREINHFYLDKGIRERIERSGEGFQVLNSEIRFSPDELKSLIDSNPERFSPNVVLRPLYQEMILPNLAYLGGPAEVVYWLQLKGIFDHFGVPFPVLLPRNFALILNGPVLQKMEKLGWNWSDVFVDFEIWKKGYVEQLAQVDFNLNEESQIISGLFDKKGKEAATLEKSLESAFQAGKVRSLKILDQMSSKLRKAEERRLQLDINRAKAVLDFTAPGGSPQERVVNMMQFYLSNPALVEDLMACFDPLDFNMMVLEYK